MKFKFKNPWAAYAKLVLIILIGLPITFLLIELTAIILKIGLIILVVLVVPVVVKMIKNSR